MNDEPIQGRGAEKMAMTWPLQSDTPVQGKNGPAFPFFFLAVAFAISLFFSAPAFSSVCSIPCNPNCPTTNESVPICEPVSFLASGDLESQILLSGESTNATISVTNSENITLNCFYSIQGEDSLVPVPIASGESALFGPEEITAPLENPGYQQRVPVVYQVMCEARTANATGDKYLWCGATCQEFSSFYQYPTNEEVREYQEEKLEASEELSSAILAVSEARKIIEKAIEALSKAPSSVERTFAEYRLVEAENLLAEALSEYGEASYAFDQTLFENVTAHSEISKTLANEARRLASEAYSSLTYTPSGSGITYLSWYINTTGIMIGEIEELLNTIEPIAEGAPGVLGGAFGAWMEDLANAKDLLKKAEDAFAKGDSENAKGLLEEAVDLLLRIKRSIEETFDRVYSELLKAAINSHRDASNSRDALEILVNRTLSVEGLNTNDFAGIRENLKKAGNFLSSAEERIKAAEAATAQNSLRKEVNLALIKISNARVELTIATAKYRIATFKFETLVATVSILAAILSIGIIFFDLGKKKRLEDLSQVKDEALGIEKPSPEPEEKERVKKKSKGKKGRGSGEIETLGGSGY